MPEAEVKGEQGFEKKLVEKAKEEMITKEETMFQIDKEGKAISEKYPVYLYDRNIDEELMSEGMLLMQAVKKQKAINGVIAEEQGKLDVELKDLKAKLEKETDELVKKELNKEFDERKSIKEQSSIQSMINSKIIEEGLKESREIISELKKEKEKQKVKKFVELVPCMCAESIVAFEKGKTIDNKPTDDWVSDLISKKLVNPSYTLEEAKRLKPDYKIALKDAIMAASNYKSKNYRDIIMDLKLAEEKPLIIKKD